MPTFLRDNETSAQHGLARLGPTAISLLEAIDSQAVAWAAEVGADEVRFPPLVRVHDLASIDYFDNFPQLPLLVSQLTDAATSDPQRSRLAARGLVSGHDLAGAGYALPSAACYSVYFDLRGTTGLEPTKVTTRGRCFRNEVRYEHLRRLWGFEMREIVYLGNADGAAEHLAAFKSLLSEWCALLRLDVSWQTAVDPFFDKRSPRALAQAVAPVKEELVYQGQLAIASVNAHRNFFGDRCQISDGDGAPVHTSCVAFGLERWVSALLDSGQQPEELVALIRESR